MSKISLRRSMRTAAIGRVVVLASICSLNAEPVFCTFDKTDRSDEATNRPHERWSGNYGVDVTDSKSGIKSYRDVRQKLMNSGHLVVDLEKHSAMQAQSAVKTSSSYTGNSVFEVITDQPREKLLTAAGRSSDLEFGNCVVQQGSVICRDANGNQNLEFDIYPKNTNKYRNPSHMRAQQWWKQQNENRRPPNMPAVTVPLLGATLKESTTGGGSEIIKIQPGGPIDKIGFSAGDTIVAINDGYASDPGQIHRKLNEYGEGHVVYIAVRRSIGADIWRTIKRDVLLSTGSTSKEQTAKSSVSPYGRALLSKKVQGDLFALIHPEVAPHLRLMYQGDFDALLALIRKELNDYTAKSGVDLLFGGIPGIGDTLERKKEESRYEGLMAQYIFVKTDVLGSCGEPGVKFKVSHQTVTTWRNGYGGYVSEDRSPVKYTHFEVPKRFSRIVDQSEITKRSGLLASGLNTFVQRAGGCKSKILGKLEDNMIEFFNYKK